MQLNDLIILALFAYPGAVVDWIYRILCTNYNYYHKLDGVAEAAKYFVFSVVCTVASLGTMGLLAAAGNPVPVAAVCAMLAAGDKIWAYLFISMCIAVLNGFLLFALRHWPMRWAYNIINRRRGISMETGIGSVWADLTNEPDNILEKCAVLIYKGKRFVAAGFPDYFPNDPSELCFALKRTDDVMQYIDYPNEMLEYNSSVYYDAKADLKIVFVYAQNLHDAISRHSSQ